MRGYLASRPFGSYAFTTMQRRLLAPVVFASVVAFALAPLACSSGSTGVPAIVTQPPPTGGDGSTSGGGDTGTGTDGAVTADAADAADAAPLDDSCTNKKFDTGETDIDCGGPKCPKCIDGKTCVAATDCTGGFCESNTKQCATPSCQDTLKNGGETDVDCGGTTACRRCALGRGCLANTDCVSGTCVDGACACPPRMVTVPKATGGAYCMDDTEVTNGDYDRFIRANVPAVGSGSTQPASCVDNTNYVPSDAWPPSQPLSQSFGLPVRHVDWCDAVAYCKWAGKTLCGDVAGQPLAPADASSASKDAWYNACSAQGANTVYPYGGMTLRNDLCFYDPQGLAQVGLVSEWTDQGAYQGIPVTVPLKKWRLCQGGVTNLYQMSGNVSEWTNSCAGAGANDNCLIRGGSYDDMTGGDRTCTAAVPTPRMTKRADIGLRCCQF